VAPSSSSGSDPPGFACSGFLSCVFTLERDRFRWEKWSVIDVCLWLVFEAVAAAVVVVVVEALDEDGDEEMHGGGADDDNDTGVAVVGLGGEPDSRESGGGSLAASRPRMDVVSQSPLLPSFRPWLSDICGGGGSEANDDDEDDTNGDVGSGGTLDSTSHSHRPPSTLSGRPLSKSKLYFFDCSTRVFCSSRLTNLRFSSWSTGPKRARFTREVSGSAGGAARGRFPLSPPFPPPAPPSPLEPDGFLLKFWS